MSLPPRCTIELAVQTIRRLSFPDRWAALLAFVFLALVPAAAWANVYIPRVSDGRGIKVGQRSTFHPGFAVTTGYDSNVYWAKGQGQEEVRGGGIILPTAWLGLGNREVRDGLLQSPPEPTDRIFDYNLAVLAGYRIYLSGRDNIRKQSRFNVGIQGRFILLPGRRFSAELNEDFVRVAEPRNWETGPGANFNRFEHIGSLALTVRPGGGRLSLSGSYSSGLLRYEGRDLTLYDRLVNGAAHETKWRFLPKSSVVVRYTFYNTYYYCCQQVGLGRNEDNNAHRVLGGYQGLVGKKVVLDAMVGWGWGLYRVDANGPSFRSFIGNASVTYFPTLRTELQLGVERSFADSLFGNYYVDAGGRIYVRHLFRWNMLGFLGLSVLSRRYHGLPEPGVEDARIDSYEGVERLRRDDVLVSLDTRLEQALGRFFVVGVRYTLTVDRTDFVVNYVPTPAAPQGLTDFGGFTKHVAMLLLAVRF